MTDIAPHASPNAGAAAPDVAAQAAPLARHRTGFVVAFCAALFMTFTQALGTGVAGLGVRLAYWLIVMLTGATIGAGVTTGVQSWGRMRAHPWLEAAIISVLIALPLTITVVGASMLMMGMPQPSPMALLQMFGLVAMVSMTITAINYAIGLGQKDKVADAPAAMETAMAMEIVHAEQPLFALPPPAEDRFKERLPHHLRGAALLALQAEDHYLRVHTDGGDTLILMRLSDAIAELAAIPGAQTHRSWWVARDAVLKSVRSDGKVMLTLRSEIEAPVSRNYVKALSEAGWFR